MTLLIYIAGPYRAATAWGVEQNIQRARAVGAIVARCGHYPVIPHSNTSHFDGLADDKVFLEGTLKLLERCDGAVFIEGWDKSEGCRAEWSRARELSITSLDFWARGEAAHAAIEQWLARVVAEKSSQTGASDWGDL